MWSEPMNPASSLPDDVAISVRNVAKKYRLFSTTHERLKEALHPFRKRYHKEFWALKDVSFEIRRGETVGIVGRNGAGKSTLLQILTGVLQPTRGDVRTRGRVAALLELGAGFNPEFTGRENVLLHGAIMGVSRQETLERMGEVEAFADIGAFFDQPVKTYSSGMFMRVAFAAAITVDPDILIVDEALSVGDAAFQEKCFRRLKTLQENGATIVLVTHANELVPRFCSSAIVIHDGQLVYQGWPAQAVNKYEELIFGDDSVEISDDSSVDVDRGGVGTMRYDQRRSYNANHHRMGDGRAELLDYVVVAGDDVDATNFPSNIEVEIYARFRFLAAVKRLNFGFGLQSTDGVMIYGTNTEMSAQVPPQVGAGEEYCWRVRFWFRVPTGHYFLNLGCAEMTSDGPQFLDNRRSLAMFEVRSAERMSGVADLEGSIDLIDHKISQQRQKGPALVASQ